MNIIGTTWLRSFAYITIIDRVTCDMETLRVEHETRMQVATTIVSKQWSFCNANQCYGGIFILLRYMLTKVTKIRNIYL